MILAFLFLFLSSDVKYEIIVGAQHLSKSIKHIALDLSLPSVFLNSNVEYEIIVEGRQ